jgi:hypothetical protein
MNVPADARDSFRLLFSALCRLLFAALSAFWELLIARLRLDYSY